MSKSTRVKQWDRPEVFDTDDAAAFEDKHLTGAMAGVAFVAASYTEDGEDDAIPE